VWNLERREWRNLARKGIAGTRATEFPATCQRVCQSCYYSRRRKGAELRWHRKRETGLRGGVWNSEFCNGKCPSVSRRKEQKQNLNSTAAEETTWLDSLQEYVVTDPDSPLLIEERLYLRRLIVCELSSGSHLGIRCNRVREIRNINLITFIYTKPATGCLHMPLLSDRQTDSQSSGASIRLQKKCVGRSECSSCQARDKQHGCTAVASRFWGV